MEEALRAILLAAAGVTALAPAGRINWGAHPQGVALPALVLNVIDNAPGLTMQGSDGLWQGRVQVDCYADSYSAAKLLARAVSDALHGHRSGQVRLVALIGTRDSREGGTNEAARPYRVGLDFNVNWRE